MEGYSRLTLAEVLTAAGALGEAEAELGRLDDVIAKSATAIVAFPAAMLRADLGLAQDPDPRAGLEALAAAMALGRSENARRCLLSTPRTARLCALALRARIEPEFVRGLIRTSEIAPPREADETWPWPLAITTFGGLRVEVDGAPLAFSRKTPKRLIALLKAIVAHGGSAVSEERLVDAVWPDEEGDAGHRALRIAIHRLRKLLGDTAAITVRGGGVGLDPARCWLDMLTFEACLARRGRDETEADHRRRVERGLALYRGDFLEGDDDLWWTTERRERLRDAYRRGRRLLETASG